MQRIMFLCKEMASHPTYLKKKGLESEAEIPKVYLDAFNVEDIANNLKRGGSFIPGVRPGKQTRDFLDGVISRITIVGALFLSFIALFQAYVPALTGIRQGNYLFGTSLLILVSVALDTMRQIESNLLMKHYGQG